MLFFLESLAGLGTMLGLIALPVYALIILLVTAKSYALNGNKLAAISGICLAILSLGFSLWSFTKVYFVLPCLLLELSVIQFLKIKTGWKAGA